MYIKQTDIICQCVKIRWTTVYIMLYSFFIYIDWSEMYLSKKVNKYFETMLLCLLENWLMWRPVKYISCVFRTIWKCRNQKDKETTQNDRKKHLKNGIQEKKQNRTENIYHQPWKQFPQFLINVCKLHYQYMYLQLKLHVPALLTVFFPKRPWL